MPFRDRDDAGRQLALRLLKFKGQQAVVFALPRGGAPVAAPIAETLGAPLDLVLVRKIGVPFQPELAMGAVADGGTPITVRNEDVIAIARVSEEAFAEVRQRELEEIERRRWAYVGSRPRPEAQGHVAIVVDDGVATGATTRAALRAVRALKPSKLVLATPVAPPETLDSPRRRPTRRFAWKPLRTSARSGVFTAIFARPATPRSSRSSIGSARGRRVNGSG